MRSDDPETDPDPRASSDTPRRGPITDIRSLALWFFLLTRFSASIALQMHVVAIGWRVYALTDSALDLGLIGLIQFMGSFCLTLPAGTVVDRYSRRGVLMAALAVETLAEAGLVVLTLSDSMLTGLPLLFSIFGLVATFGAAYAFDQPAIASLLPAVVPADRLPRAVAWSSSANQAAVLFGPAMGGFLYTAHPAAPFIACTSFLVLGLIAASLIRPSVNHRPTATAAGEGNRWNRVLGGLHFVWKNERLLGALTLDLFSVLFGGATALLPIYARDILQIGPIGLGLLYSAPGFGALGMAMVLGRHPLHGKVGRTMLLAIGSFGVATIVFGLSRSLPLSLLALIVAGASDTVSVVVRSTLVQSETPDGLLGRVSAVNSLFVGTSNQLGEFESGIAAASLGPVASVVVGGLMTVFMVVLWGWRFRALRGIEKH